MMASVIYFVKSIKDHFIFLPKDTQSTFCRRQFSKYIPVLVTLSLLGHRTQLQQLKMKRCIWLMVSGESVHGWLAPRQEIMAKGPGRAKLL